MDTCQVFVFRNGADMWEAFYSSNCSAHLECFRYYRTFANSTFKHFLSMHSPSVRVPLSDCFCGKRNICQPPQIPDPDRVSGSSIENRAVGVESDLVDLILSCWDGDCPARVRRTCVPNVDLTRGAEHT